MTNCNGCTEASRKRFVAAKARSESKKKATKPEPETIIKKRDPQLITIDEIVTPEEKEKISSKIKRANKSPAQGKLIQVEGLILIEVTELTINLKTSSSPYEQIILMKNHIKKNWHYIFDPNTGTDTWRSAEATLSLKYRGQYTGDCDDYAILMASCAKQIGLVSRVVGGYNGDSGHAFAEFKVSEEIAEKMDRSIDIRKDIDTYWVSLDWFNGRDHNKYLDDIKILID